MDLTGIDLTAETIRTERLVLRPLRADDAAAVHAGCQDPAVQRWSNIPVPCTRADAEAFVAVDTPAERRAGTGTDLAIEV